MPVYQWLALALSVVVVLGGTAVNLFIMGRFVGQWSESMKTLGDTLKKIEGQVHAVETESSDTTHRASLLDQRVIVVEQATSKFWEMREDFVRMTTVVEMTGRRTQDQLDGVTRSIEAVGRRLDSMTPHN